MPAPLEGVRVLDLSTWWAGPLGTMFLADLGAEVIKIEAVQRVDSYRGTFAGQVPSDKPYETSPVFNAVNRNKRGVTLDMASPKGAEVFRRLVRASDVVCENYSARVMENLGVEYATLRRHNPTLVMVSLTGFGRSGPWRDYVAFAATVEALSGIPSVTGYAGGPPLLPGAIMGDPLPGLFCAIAVLAALEHRRRTGQGQYVDMSQLEPTAWTVADALLDFQMNRRTWPRQGNRVAEMAPHGAYRCRGSDEWVAIAVEDDDQWRRLCDAMGRPEMARDPRYADLAGRQAHADDIRQAIEAWTRQRDKREAMRLLQEAGVTAGAVLNPRDLLSDPQLESRNFFPMVDRAEVGPRPYPGCPIKLSATPAGIRSPAPLLGEHNALALGELLGMTRSEMEALAREHVIGTAPLSTPPAR